MLRTSRCLAVAGLSLAGVLVLPSLAVAAPRGGDPAARPAGKGDRCRERGRPFRSALERRATRRAHAARFLRHLELTAEQKATFAESKQAAAPVREDVAAKLRALHEAARRGERTPEAKATLRTQAQAVLTSARASVEPSATRLVGLLTPAQKEHLVARAKAKGRAYDEAKVVRAVSAMLLAPDARPARSFGRPFGRRPAR